MEFLLMEIKMVTTRLNKIYKFVLYFVAMQLLVINILFVLLGYHFATHLNPKDLIANQMQPIRCFLGCVAHFHLHYFSFLLFAAIGVRKSKISITWVLFCLMAILYAIFYVKYVNVIYLNG